MDQQIADLKSLLFQIIAKGGLDAPILNEACRLLDVPLGDPLSGDLSEAQGMALGRMLLAPKDGPLGAVIAA